MLLIHPILRISGLFGFSQVATFLRDTQGEYLQWRYIQHAWGYRRHHCPGYRL